MFYTYRQNNSGGSFREDENVGVIVIVEAPTYKIANALAETYGLYFNGAGDCNCCGNRWHEQWDDDDGKEVPSIYSKPFQEYKSKYWDESCVIYYLDGRKENHIFKCEDSIFGS